MQDQEPKPLSEAGKTLHEKMFDKNNAVDQNAKRPLKELVEEAEKMIATGETYVILIPMNMHTLVQGVPFEVCGISGKKMTLRALGGYSLMKDTPANRRQLKYIPPEEEEKEADAE